MTDDQIVGAFRGRLLAGAFGDRELLMPAEQDYSGMWSGLCQMVPAWEQRFGFDHPLMHEVRATIHRLTDARPDAVKVFALATTRYGREGELGA